ncbi:MAG TPA: hypothetical protein VI731_03435, partial [Bacteroidia bacterium]|nr:hypothetical protein [Bacteroidia bacterium]
MATSNPLSTGIQGGGQQGGSPPGGAGCALSEFTPVKNGRMNVAKRKYLRFIGRKLIVDFFGYLRIALENCDKIYAMRAR